MISVNEQIILKDVYLDVFKQALLGYCQNGESPEQATEQALDVVRIFSYKAFNKKDSTLSTDRYDGIQKIELLAGKKIPVSKRYFIIEAIKGGESPKNILANNPDLFDKA